MTNNQLLPTLFSLQDASFRTFNSRLIPNIAPETIIGVRTPELRRIAKELDDGDEFLRRLPHHYFEENLIHGFLLERERDFGAAIAGVEDFLPYVDNWAVCDQLNPKVFKKRRQELLPYIRRWIASDQVYTIRFAIGMLMRHFLDEDFDPDYLQQVAAVRNEDYYVKMMVAWYFATALAKQYDAALPYIIGKHLQPWTHNKAIQKAVESFRISDDQKALLRQYKIR